MNTAQALSLIFLTIILACTAYAVYKKTKKVNSKVDTESFLEEFIDDLIDFAKDALNVLKLDRYKFKSDGEFEDALIGIVVNSFRDMLINDAQIRDDIMNLLTDDVLEQFVRTAISLYRGEIGIDNVIKKSTDEIPDNNLETTADDVEYSDEVSEPDHNAVVEEAATEEAVSSNEVPEGKVDILDEINKTQEEE